LFLLVFEFSVDCDSKVRFILSFAAAAIYATNPIVWFYGCLSDIYPVEACMVTVLCYFLFLSFKRPALLPLISIVFGLTGGIRLTTEVFLFPVYLFVISKANKRTILLSLLCLMISNLLWLIPTILLSGGFKNYQRMVFNQGLRASATAGFNFDPFFEISASLLQIITLPLLILLCTGIHKIRIRSQEIFLLIAILPALLFFLFIHFPKHGYLLVLVPTVIALSVSILRHLQYSPLLVSTVLSVSIILNYFIFIKPPIYKKDEVKNEIAKAFIYEMTFPNNHVRNIQEERLRLFFTRISEIGSKKKLFVVDNGYFPNFRIVMYYFPNDITVTWLTRKKVTIATSHKIETVRQPIYLKDDEERVVVLIGGEPSGINFHSFNVNEHEYYYEFLDHLPVGFKIYEFQFVKS
jgi:hypothetical protein